MDNSAPLTKCVGNTSPTIKVIVMVGMSLPILSKLVRHVGHACHINEVPAIGVGK